MSNKRGENIMRRFLSIILVGTLALGIASCAKEPAASTAESENSEVTTEATAEEPVDNSLNCQEDILTRKGIRVVK